MSRKTRSRPYDVDSAPAARQVVQHLTVTIAVAALLATIFTAWTPAGLNPMEVAGQLLAALEREPAGESVAEDLPPAFIPGEDLRIGLVVGHAGPHPDTGEVDPGAVCPDGLTELEINQSVAEIVKTALEAAGIEVDLMDEWDERLFGYRSVALVSIHADVCVPINDLATGYKVTAAVDTVVPDKAQRLVSCLVDRYGGTTELRFHPGSITRDMTEYHTFREIHSQTPAAIIEVGFMYLDREILTERPELVARGISDGILCYINNEPADLYQGQ